MPSALFIRHIFRHNISMPETNRNTLLSAPIQEYTDAAFRNAHARCIGGIDEYYAPFIRLEQGNISKRSAVDIAPANNQAANTVPQILVKNAEETRNLVLRLSEYGFQRVDINCGCPFPKVVKNGYGSGIMANPENLRNVLEEAVKFTDIHISVKMRLGLADENECLKLLPWLNDFPLEKIVLHARTARQQYGGSPDREAFRDFRDACAHPVFYNGDICSEKDAAGLNNIMIGRGLLANPLLPLQIKGLNASLGLLTDFHNVYVEECCRLYTQPLLKLKLLWDYFLPNADKPMRKAIAKSRTVDEYLKLTKILLG